ncbi:hypothetical protein E2C01_068787 [Portunus trituberculatus]|uniref:Secreted protein n=1 Tax=Portunus trituberculatus TaxID=210409 RepID=A0A5B7HXL7_PORTR|nr:hypothetical protein [Portunus trituberculatus]
MRTHTRLSGLLFKLRCLMELRFEAVAVAVAAGHYRLLSASPAPRTPSCATRRVSLSKRSGFAYYISRKRKSVEQLESRIPLDQARQCL